MKNVTRTLFLTIVATTVFTISRANTNKTLGVPIYSDLTHLTQNIPLSANDPFVKDILSFTQQLETLLDDYISEFDNKTPNGGGSNGWSSGNSNPSGPNGSPTGSPSAPLDGGIVFLLIAGLGLGLKIVLDKNKQKKVAVAYIAK
jgi:hypothetical protein